MTQRLELRVLVLAPSGRDAPLAAEVLSSYGLEACCCGGAEELRDQLRRGAAVAIIAGEALVSGARELVFDYLRGQEYWSELPVIVLARRGEDLAALHAAVAAQCNMTILERPVQIGTLVAAVRAAVRARQRQYEVRDLVEQLRETDRRKDEFLAMLGHELRNPLGVIRTALELLAAGDASAPARQLSRIDHQISHLSRMVDDLLDLSRVSRGRIILQRQPCELGQLVAAAIDACAPLTRGRQVEHCRPCEALWVDGDPVRLEQVVTNLLQNALKYTPAEKPIAVSVGRQDGAVQLRVRDEGIGIRQEELSRIFDTFAQVSTSLDRAAGGLGLGLSLVRHLVRLHGGRVEAHSAGPGKGSEFVVQLPLLPEHRIPRESSGGEAGASRARSTGRRPIAADGAARSFEGGHDPLHGDQARAEPVLPRLLLVEDLEDAREALGELLRLHGFEVDLAADGLTALDLAALHPPQVALVDIGLPGLDGYQLGRRLREQLGAGLTLIAMTGYGQSEDRRRSRQAGFDHHLVKPVHPDQLLELLRMPVPPGDRLSRLPQGAINH